MISNLTVTIRYQTIIALLLQQFIIFLSFSQKNDSIPVHFSKIDSIVRIGIESKAFPGAVVLAAHQDSIIYFKNHGYHTYDSVTRVKKSNLYDLASVTKIYGATLALMKLYENGYIELDEPMRKYVKGFWLNRRGGATLRELLTHQAGWQSWIRYYDKMIKEQGDYRKRFFREETNEKYNIKIRDGLFLTNKNYKYIKRKIKRAEFDPGKGYEYSGLFFYLVPEMVQYLTDTSYENYLSHHFYEKMNLKTLGYNPLDRFEKDVIVPTEIDTFFRMTPIHGKVHDEGAILMEGVSGNAGLFSNAEDVYVVSKLLMNYGQYDSLKLLDKETVTLFTTTQFPNEDNRRALGFDKPLLKYDSVRSSIAEHASHLSFGHSGYTGTLVWIDPDEELIFVFFSNRVYPSRNQRALYELNLRPSIHDLLYEYIKTGWANRQMDR